MTTLAQVILAYDDNSFDSASFSRPLVNVKVDMINEILKYLATKVDIDTISNRSSSSLNQYERSYIGNVGKLKLYQTIIDLNGPLVKRCSVWM